MRRNEAGVVLILLAFMASALVAMIALALDLSRLGENKDSARSAGRLAAVAAAEGWFAAGSEENSARYCSALIRAKSSINSNLIANLGAQQISPRLVPYRAVTGCAAADAAAAAAPGAKLIPGMWHPAKPASADPCSGNYPCFRPNDPVQNIADAPNAFKVEGEIFRDISFFLADKILKGIALHNIYVSAVGTVIPRRGIFLVDVTPTMVRETHRYRSIDGGTAPNWDDQQHRPDRGLGREFGFFLPADNPYSGVGANNHTSHYNMLLNAGPYFDFGPPFGKPSGTYSPPQGQPLQQTDIVSPPFTPFNTTAASTRSRIHFASEYVRKAILSDMDYGDKYKDLHPDPNAPAPWGSSYAVGTDRYWYRVDIGKGRRRPAAGGQTEALWDKPEPLSSVMAGLNVALGEFKLRQVAGDMAGMIFFEHALQWPRIVLPTDNFDYMQRLIKFSRPAGIGQNADVPGISDDNPASFTSADATADPQPGYELELAIRHHLFPSANGYTDYLMAVEEALNQLNSIKLKKGNSVSADFILLITDGLATCCRTAPPASFPIGKTFGSSNKGAICNPMCDSHRKNWDEAMLQLAHYADAVVRPAGVPIHIMLLGEMVKPHIRAQQVNDPATNTKRCMTDREARAANVLYVRPPYYYNTTADQWFAINETAPWYDANLRMYEIARLTRGLWMPIRRYDAAAPNDPQCGDGAVNPAYRETDRRQPGQQVVDYMKQLLRDNPYMVVESK